MKRNDLNNIKGLDVKSLLAKALQLKQEIVDLTLDKHTNKLTDLKVFAKKRKEIAQILTIARQKDLLEKIEKGEVS